MDEEDDDFYDPADVVPPTQGQNTYQNDNPQAEHVDEELEEEEEEEDDDDEFNIITEAPPDAAPVDATHSRHATFRGESQQLPSADGSLVPKSATPQTTSKGGARTPVTASATLAAPQKPGSEYPAIHTSTLDVNANPIHPTTGKPILSTDMDSDFPTDDKPWRRPGSDISDYFNYGFDEFTWASYVLKQQELRKEVGDQKKQMDEMQAFLGMPSMPGGPPPGPAPSNNAMQAMPTMPGMPDLSPDAMQSVFSTMMQQGMDPSSMDPVTFMQHAQAILGGQSGAGGGQQGQPGFGGQQGQGFGGQGGGQHQMGYGGYEQRGGYGGGRGRGRRW